MEARHRVMAVHLERGSRDDPMKLKNTLPGQSVSSKYRSWSKSPLNKVTFDQLKCNFGIYRDQISTAQFDPYQDEKSKSVCFHLLALLEDIRRARGRLDNDLNNLLDDLSVAGSRPGDVDPAFVGTSEHIHSAMQDQRAAGNANLDLIQNTGDGNGAYARLDHRLYHWAGNPKKFEKLSQRRTKQYEEDRELLRMEMQIVGWLRQMWDVRTEPHQQALELKDRHIQGLAQMNQH